MKLINDDEVNKINQSKICIFGFCEVGKIIYNIIDKELDISNIFFCDNDSTKQGKHAEGEVLSVAEAIKKNAVFILGSQYYQTTMRKQLIESGLDSEKIVNINYEVVEAELIKFRTEKKLRPLSRIQFEVDLAEHCNLNCKCCSQFAQISKEAYYDLDQYKKDIARMSVIFSGEAERIFLIGGEPLLNKCIADFIVITRRSFPKTDIAVFTNGILLKDMKQDFWDTVRENEIEIIVTKYPIKIDYEYMENLAVQNGIRFRFFKMSKDFKYMRKIPLDLNGKQDAFESFVLCEEANNCIKLKNGKLYTCTRPAAIHKFNEYFGQNLVVDKGDYIDIYQKWTAEEILEKLSQPIPFCKYCIKKGKMLDFDWAVSEKTIEEYV